MFNHFSPFRRSRYHTQVPSASTATTNFRDQQNLSNDDYQFPMGNHVLPAAFGQLFSATSPNTTDQDNNESTVAFVSAPKNVKFLIPLARSGADSNQSSFGVIDSTTGTITHVKDIFPFHPLVPSAANNNHQTDTHPSSTSIVKREEEQEQHDMSNDECEELPLLFHDDSKDK